MNHLLVRRRPGKKIFIPGILSLTLLLPFLMAWYWKTMAPKRYYVIETNWLEPGDYPAFREVIKRKIVRERFVLDGSRRDNENLRQIRVMVQTILETGDTTHVVKVRLDGKAKYESLVALFSLQVTEAVVMCVAVEDDFWIYLRGSSPPTKSGNELVAGWLGDWESR